MSENSALQPVHPEKYPALYTALAYLYVDGVPAPLPVEFTVLFSWDLPRLEAALGGLQRPEGEPDGGSEGVGRALDSELWRFVCSNDADVPHEYEDSCAELKAKYPQLDLEYVDQLINSCFEGEDSDTWFDHGPLEVLADSMRAQHGGG